MASKVITWPAKLAIGRMCNLIGCNRNYVYMAVIMFDTVTDVLDQNEDSAPWLDYWFDRNAAWSRLLTQSRLVPAVNCLCGVSYRHGLFTLGGYSCVKYNQF